MNKKTYETIIIFSYFLFLILTETKREHMHTNHLLGLALTAPLKAFLGPLLALSWPVHPILLCVIFVCTGKKT